jgi:DNA polymerase theta
MVVAELRQCVAGLDPLLEQSIPKGVAFHHAGLTVEERDIIERAFRNGLINILAATSTLAAGVNLPARRVIFRTPVSRPTNVLSLHSFICLYLLLLQFIGSSFLDPAQYRQMAGRAGRMGKDSFGESVLMAKPSEKDKIAALLQTNLPPLLTCLTEQRRGMVRALMEVIANGAVATVYDIERFVHCTLFSIQQ